MRSWIGAAAALFVAVGLTACTGSENADDAGEGKDSGPSVIQPGKPGESNRTLSPEEAQASAQKEKPNDADFGYMQDMIVHHSQAIEMTDLAADSAVAPKVKAIAGRIAAAQGPEIDAMNRWLEDNGREPVLVPGATGYEEGGHQGHGVDHGDMPGMASEQEMKDLSSARGAKFDQLFLKLMIRHHEGALTMAREVQQNGSDVLVQENADHVIASQSAEILRMKKLQQ